MENLLHACAVWNGSKPQGRVPCVEWPGNVQLSGDVGGTFGEELENIARWLPQQRADGMSAFYLREWERILDSGLDRIL